MKTWMDNYRKQFGIEFSIGPISVGLKRSPKWGREVAVEAE